MKLSGPRCHYQLKGDVTYMPALLGKLVFRKLLDGSAVNGLGNLHLLLNHAKLGRLILFHLKNIRRQVPLYFQRP